MVSGYISVFYLGTFFNIISVTQKFDGTDLIFFVAFNFDWVLLIKLNNNWIIWFYSEVSEIVYVIFCAVYFTYLFLIWLKFCFQSQSSVNRVLVILSCLNSNGFFILLVYCLAICRHFIYKNQYMYPHTYTHTNYVNSSFVLKFYIMLK